jgi:hypothetical protein
LPKAFQYQEKDICLDNGKTKERLLIKMYMADPNLEKRGKIALLISRHPLTSTKALIGGEEVYPKSIFYLCDDLKVIEI